MSRYRRLTPEEAAQFDAEVARSLDAFLSAQFGVRDETTGEVRWFAPYIPEVVCKNSYLDALRPTLWQRIKYATSAVLDRLLFVGDNLWK